VPRSAWIGQIFQATPPRVLRQYHLERAVDLEVAELGTFWLSSRFSG
jgi:hypothetical protein